MLRLERYLLLHPGHSFPTASTPIVTNDKITHLWVIYYNHNKEFLQAAIASTGTVESEMHPLQRGQTDSQHIDRPLRLYCNTHQHALRVEHFSLVPTPYPAFFNVNCTLKSGRACMLSKITCADDFIT